MGRTEQPGLAHLDTHVVIWLYEGRVEAISPAARAMIERGRCIISPMVRLELQYLYEIGRNALDADSVLVALRKLMELDVADGDFDGVVKTAMSMNWTRDVFDRLITAQALHERTVLVTRDRKIRENYSGAVW